MSLISSTMLSLDSVVSLNTVVPRIWAEVEKASDGLYALTSASAPADVADRRFSEACLIEAPIPEGVPSAEYEVSLWVATTDAMMFALQLQMVLSSIGLHVAVYNVPIQATETGISVLMPDKMPEPACCGMLFCGRFRRRISLASAPCSSMRCMNGLPPFTGRGALPPPPLTRSFFSLA